MFSAHWTCTLDAYVAVGTEKQIRPHPNYSSKTSLCAERACNVQGILMCVHLAAAGNSVGVGLWNSLDGIVLAAQGRLSALSVSHSESNFYGAFVRTHRA